MTTSYIDKNKPYYDKKHNFIIPNNEQFFTLTVGQRGAGKSATQELLLEELYKKGWTCFDAWSAGLESMFYCVNLNCREKRKNKVADLKLRLDEAIRVNDTQQIETLTDAYYEEKDKLGCTCHKRFPITVLCNEAMDIEGLDMINGKYYTKDEWIAKCRKEGEIIVTYDRTNRPVKPESERKEWIKIVKLPFPSKSDGTEINAEIMKRFSDALLDARKNHRILCYVPSLFPTDYTRYRTLAVIVTNLPKVTEEHFQPYYEGQDIMKPKKDWSLEQKNHHRIVVLFRELAELAPAQMKTNEFANLTKRAILSIIFTSRHSRISILSDVQKVESVLTNVRTMTNSIIIKRSTASLLGDELKDIKKRIENMQEKLFLKFGRGDDARAFVYSKYPPIERLSKNYCYVLYDDDYIEKWKIDGTAHHKKQEDDSFFKLTGFKYSINAEIMKSNTNKKSELKIMQKNNDKELVEFIQKLRDDKTQWKDVRLKLIQEQKKGKFDSASDYSKQSQDSIRIWFKRVSTSLKNSDK